MKPLVFALLVLAPLAGCLADDPEVQEAAAPGTDLDVPGALTDLRLEVADLVGSGSTVSLSTISVASLTGSDPDPGAEEDLSFVLVPATTVDNGTWARIDDVPVAMPDIDLYEGHVEGDETRLVRLAVTDDWARGLVLPLDQVVGPGHLVSDGAGYQLIRMGLEGNLPPGEWPESSGRGGASDGAWLPAEERAMSQPVAFDGPGMVYDRDCLELVPPYAAWGPLASGGTQVVDIIMDADAEAYHRLGDDTLPILAAMLHEVDGIYQQQVDVRLRLAGLHAHTEMEHFPDPAAEPPLGVLADYWNQRDDERDVVNLVTGRESSFAMANCIGGAGHPDVGYTFTPLNWAEDYTVFHMTALAHELGHIFGAHHHYGNHVEQHMASIMIQGYTPGILPAFSTLSKSVIRGWIENEVPQ
ncbi:MAG: M12 family metallo-peptidase [Thermoplasmatota archaeon]